MQQRAAGRQRVGRGAGWRGDDQSVGALVGHKTAIDFDPQFDHARSGPPVDHHIVHRGGAEDAAAVANHLGLHHPAPVFVIFAAQHGLERRLEILEGDVGDEAQAALVDADQRHTELGQLPSYAQHGAVAPDHQCQVAMRTDAGHIEHRVLRQAGVAGRVFFQRDIATLSVQKVCNFFQGRA